VFWTANAVNAAGQLTQATAGNGVTTNRAFDALTGRLTGVTAGASNSVANLGFAYDALGNLASRSDPLSFGSESFTYDALNRLLTAQVSGQAVHSVSYNAIGNILTKTRLDNNSLANAYSYNAAGQARPHAVASVAGLVNGVLNPVYSYDLNGNLTSGAGRTVTWTAFNMVASIVQGATNMSYAYDSEHARITQSEVNGANTTTTNYLNDPASGLSSEKVVAGSTTTWTDYLFAGGARVAQRSMVVGGATSLRYFITDHLGSIAVITDGGGAVLERLAYDAWGKRRNTNGSDDPAGAVTSATTRGFTDHEHISSVGLVNMNGRVYDPELGRFLSADPIVPSIFMSQALNRFSYVYNRPLSITDPTGYFGAAEIVITAFRVNPVVAAVATIFSAIFGGLFGGHHAVAAVVRYPTFAAPSAPPSPVAAAGGSPSGLPQCVHELMMCGDGACEIVITGIREGAVALSSSVARITVAALSTAAVTGAAAYTGGSFPGGTDGTISGSNVYAADEPGGMSRRPGSADNICRDARTTATVACGAAAAGSLLVCGVTLPTGGTGCMLLSVAIEYCTVAGATAVAICAAAQATEKGRGAPRASTNQNPAAAAGSPDPDHPNKGDLKRLTATEMRDLARRDGYDSVERWKQQELRLNSGDELFKDGQGNVYSMGRGGTGEAQSLGLKIQR
jgi:RHS repeat-associated protein